MRDSLAIGLDPDASVASTNCLAAGAFVALSPGSRARTYVVMTRSGRVTDSVSFRSSKRAGLSLRDPRSGRDRAVVSAPGEDARSTTWSSTPSMRPGGSGNRTRCIASWRSRRRATYNARHRGLRLRAIRVLRLGAGARRPRVHEVVAATTRHGDRTHAGHRLDRGRSACFLAGEPPRRWVASSCR